MNTTVRVPVPRSRPDGAPGPRGGRGGGAGGAADGDQQGGQVREDMDFGDLPRMAAGITATTFTDDARRDRVLAVTLDGVRAAR